MGIFKPKRQFIEVLSIFLLILSLFPPFRVQAADVTDSVNAESSRSFYNRRTGEFSFSVILTNISSTDIGTPLIVIVKNISSPAVTVSNADGTDPSGNPYFDYSALVGDDGLLNPGEASGAKKWIFNNPRNVRFTYKLEVQGSTPQTDSNPPLIAIKNPLDNEVALQVTQIDIYYSDNESGIDLDSLNIKLDGMDYTSSFSKNDTKASYRLTSPLDTGPHTLEASIGDNAGNTNSVTTEFTISSSNESLKYLFSISGSDWIYASPGDGTCVEYLRPEDLGIQTVSDVVGLSRPRPSGNVFFSLSGLGGIFQSPTDGSNSTYLDNLQLGFDEGSQISAVHIDLGGTSFLAINGDSNLYQSIGDHTYALFIQNSGLGIDYDNQVTCLHIGYDGTIYFCRSDEAGIFKSIGDGNNTQFLSPVNLGVPGHTINAFAILPELIPPTITITNPMDGAFLNTTTPAITIHLQDQESGIDTASFYAEINGVDMTNSFSVTGSGATYQVPDSSPLPVGANTLSVRVRDRVGNESTATSHFTVGILRAKPGATPTSGPSPLTVHFTTDGEDPAGTIEVFRWDFDGDGQWDTYDTVARDYDHTYSHSGTYNAVLYVQSSTGDTATASVAITVNNNPPIASADVTPSNGQVPLTVQMSGSGTDSDGNIVLYEWDFDGDGTFDWSSTTTGNTSHTYTEVGTYNAVFRVTDNEGATATAVAMTSVVSVGPEGSPTAQGSATPDNGPAPLTVQFNGTGTDPDGTIVRYEWDFDNDGTYDWSSISSAATTHTYATPGTYVAALRVTDNSGNTGVDYVLIEVGLQVSLEITDSDKTFNPYANEAMGIAASINAPVPASVLIRNADGQTVRTIPLDTTSQPVPLFTDNMENGDNGWTHGGSNDLWQLGIPSYGPGSARSGSNSWGTNLSGPYANNINCWLLSPPVQITEPSQLTFYQYFASESYYDGGIVEITTDGNNFSRLSPVGGYPYHGVRFGGDAYSGSLGGWSKQAFDLSGYVGQTVQIRFRFISDYSVTRAGWYIDDVRIAKNPSSVSWNGRDDNNLPVTDGVYYAVLRYQYNGTWHEYDLSNTTGGQRFVPPRQSTGGSSYHPALARPFEDQFLPIHFSLNSASEVTLFVGILWNTNTRIRTIYNRVPMPAGSHTAYWDGLDDAGNIAEPPPGNYLILGIWGYTLPDNAIYVTGGRPVISNLAANPNYFCPFSEKCDADGNGEGVLLSYHLSEDVVSVELRVYNTETGYLLRTATMNNVSAGDNVFFWDGKNNNGEYVDMGDYRIGLIATETEGNKSMLSYTLVRINY